MSQLTKINVSLGVIFLCFSMYKSLTNIKNGETCKETGSGRCHCSGGFPLADNFQAQCLPGDKCVVRYVTSGAKTTSSAGCCQDSSIRCKEGKVATKDWRNLGSILTKDESRSLEKSASSKLVL